MEEIKALEEIEKIVSMGIIGIDEVLEKVSSKVLSKTLVDAKKKYLVFKNDVGKYLQELGQESKEINIFVKTFNEMYTNLSLLNGNDSKIVKMLIEGTNKGILHLEMILNKELEDEKVKKFATELLDVLEFQIKEWKKYL